MISLLLNLPYTITGIILALLLGPTKIEWGSKPYRIVFTVKRSFGFGYMKNWRAMACGNVIILNPRVEAGDLEHEIIHVRQHDRHPFIYPILYYIELLRHGYRKNKYEEEAYREAGNVYRGVE